MHGISVFIRKDLNLNMLRLNKELLNENVIISKCFFCFTLDQFKCRSYFFL